MPFPAVVKPAIKERANALTTAKAWRVDDRAELDRRYARGVRGSSTPSSLMVQELIPGGGESQFSYAALCRDGEPLALAHGRRTRQYPADFGRASTFVETVDCPEVVEPSLRLLREIGYTGLIEIEYKRDPRDGVLKLLDMNPRLWGWHTLCARAGVDFPWLLWLLVSGERLPARRPRAGVGWLRFTHRHADRRCTELLRPPPEPRANTPARCAGRGNGRSSPGTIRCPGCSRCRCSPTSSPAGCCCGRGACSAMAGPDARPLALVPRRPGLGRVRRPQ